MKTVYVVEAGCYSDRHVSSIHSTLESAMNHYPGETWVEDSHIQEWHNTKDWSDLLSIVEMELDPQ